MLLSNNTEYQNFLQARMLHGRLLQKNTSSLLSERPSNVTAADNGTIIIVAKKLLEINALANIIITIIIKILKRKQARC